MWRTQTRQGRGNGFYVAHNKVLLVGSAGISDGCFMLVWPKNHRKVFSHVRRLSGNSRRHGNTSGIFRVVTSDLLSDHEW